MPLTKQSSVSDETFECPQVKSHRPVANPNAGFLVKLIALDKALKATSAPDPARVYRMAPDVGGAVGRQVDPPETGGPLTTAALDARTSFVIFGPAGLCAWHGERSHPEYADDL